MSNRWRYGLVAFLSVTVLLGAALFLRAQKTAAAPEPMAGGTIYYTGPMQSKGHPGTWADADGKIVAPPAPPSNPKAADPEGTHSNASKPPNGKP